MIHYKTEQEIEWMRDSALLVGKTIAELAKLLRPGATTAELEKVADTFIRDHGAVPSFKNYNGYPFATCISVNDAVVHGLPDNRELTETDVVSIDIGVFRHGFHGDSAYTFAMANASEETLTLLRVTRESLYRAIDKAVAGNRVGDVSFAVQDYCEKQHRFGVVRELVGHGLGRKLHEDPQVPNFGKRGSGAKLQPNMVIAIEPMVNMGVKDVWYDKDGWTVRTRDGQTSAHYEHTVCIRKSKADVLSSFEEVERVEKANPHLASDFY